LRIDGFESLGNGGGSEMLNHLPPACGDLETKLFILENALNGRRELGFISRSYE
jgi:hypothetical protein